MPPIDQSSFFLGLGVGILLAIFPLYPIWKTYRRWVETRKKYHKPQSIVHKTKKTPAEVAHDAKIATFKLRIVQLVAIALAIGITGIFFPDVIDRIGQIINNLLEMFFG